MPPTRVKALRTVSVVALAALAVIAAVIVLPPLLIDDTQRVSPGTGTPAGPKPPFAPDSVWNKQLADDAPVDPASPRLMKSIDGILNRKPGGSNQWIETSDYSTPVYSVGRDQATVPVELTAKGAYADTLRKAFAAGVPIPQNAKSAAGTDGHMVIVQPSTDRMWEFWQARKTHGRWTAAWGGAINGLSRSPGYFDTRAWQGAQANWGATATSLPLLGGLMRISELQSGRIDHALALALPDVRSGVVASPAQRTDGVTAGDSALPEGSRLRIAPDADLSGIRSPLVRAMATAAQKYGMIVRDRTAVGVAFFAEATRGSDPYGGREGLLEGRYPNELLAEFPWEKVKVLKMDLHKTAS